MYALHLTVASREGALIRVLGLAERRGYTPVSVGVETESCGAYRVFLDVRSSRPPALLARQLSRLREVRSVVVL